MAVPPVAACSSEAAGVDSSPERVEEAPVVTPDVVRALPKARQADTGAVAEAQFGPGMDIEPGETFFLELFAGKGGLTAAVKRAGLRTFEATDVRPDGDVVFLDLLEDGKAVLVDIRYKEEQQAWGPSFGLKIPLNELPSRLDELPKDKTIVTACPHKDRAIIAMTYLRSKGIKARYLTDGLIGLAENLRGDSAMYFLLNMSEE
jgi:rhodanese-related sulfurtransferase